MPEIIEGIEFKDGIKQHSKCRLIKPSPTFGHRSCQIPEPRYNSHKMLDQGAKLQQLLKNGRSTWGISAKR